MSPERRSSDPDGVTEHSKREWTAEGGLLDTITGAGLGVSFCVLLVVAMVHSLTH
ncbi:hypothetical protein KZI27_01075 (plasmid) [Curtobacterium sp. TC1]|uniref:hypothetical protein n=1 Tax=Curtobacterium sp. TC1 TaxID=2862880 RepID=UPI001C9AF0B4|nr:hypothetical protein [Curtobacterium sp. TC1]QZQ53768.1 hypothetical protein KZI27_01075 [Curtobacterium sp. TC1]